MPFLRRDEIKQREKEPRRQWDADDLQWQTVCPRKAEDNHPTDRNRFNRPYISDTNCCNCVGFDG